MLSHFASGRIAVAPDRARILVVEPDRRYCGVLARRLGECGYRVTAAETAQAAIAELHRMPVALVLAEARLPATTGIELVRLIREDVAHCELPILLVVGRSDRGAAVAGFEVGADGVVRKPCHFDVLAACIARQLERADAIKRLAHDNAALDARVVERTIELRELRDQLDQLARKAA